MSRRFDAIVIGAGQAGPSLAVRLAGAGMSVAVIERNLFGGTCVNTGCTPTKTLIASAYAAHTARRAADYGVIIDAPPRVDMARVKARADAVAARSRVGVESWLRGTERCTVITAHARFLAPDDDRGRRGEGERATHFHQCRRPRLRAEPPGYRRGPLSDQQHDPEAGPCPRAPGRGRRQLCRARIRADVPDGSAPG